MIYLHKSLYIDGNDEFIRFVKRYQFKGEGTWNNPYIIEDLNIDTDTKTTCIAIENVDVWFVIRNCYFRNASVGKPPLGVYGLSAGIRLINVKHAIIYNNYFASNSYGILLYNSAYNTVFGNVFIGNLNADVCMQCYSNSGYVVVGNAISNNTCIYNKIVGIDVWGECVVNNRFVNNFICNTQHGIRPYSTSTNSIHYNVICNVVYHAMTLNESRTWYITNNMCLGYIQSKQQVIRVITGCKVNIYYQISVTNADLWVNIAELNKREIHQYYVCMAKVY